MSQRRSQLTYGTDAIQVGEFHQSGAQRLLHLSTLSDIQNRAEILDQLPVANEHRNGAAMDVPDRPIGPHKPILHIEISPLADRFIERLHDKHTLVRVQDTRSDLLGQLDALRIETADPE